MLLQDILSNHIRIIIMGILVAVSRTKEGITRKTSRGFTNMNHKEEKDKRFPTLIVRYKKSFHHNVNK